MTQDNQSSQEQKEVIVLFADFLKNSPPGKAVKVSDVILTKPSYGQINYHLRIPQLKMYCSSDACDGDRFFACVFKDSRIYLPCNYNFFLEYRCRDCTESTKIFALNVYQKSANKGFVSKYGELPSFGPPTNKRVLRAMGKSKDEFLKGRRCEAQGLGKGAFTYYRNIVEERKSQLIGEIIKAAKILELPEERILYLEKAKDEHRFDSAVEKIKDLIPKALFIQGRNPLTLLHSALSKGVHYSELGDGDEECLKYANSIRVILTKLCENIDNITKQDNEVVVAIDQLLNKDSRDSNQASKDCK